MLFRSSIYDDNWVIGDFHSDWEGEQIFCSSTSPKNVTKWITMYMDANSDGEPMQIKMDITLVVGEFNNRSKNIPKYQKSYGDVFGNFNSDFFGFYVESVEDSYFAALPYRPNLQRYPMDAFLPEPKVETKVTILSASDFCRDDKKGTQILYFKNAICNDKVLRWIDNLGRVNFFAFKLVSKNDTVKDSDTWELDRETTLPKNDTWSYDDTLNIYSEKKVTSTITLAAPRGLEYFNLLKTLATSNYVDLQISSNKWQKVKVMEMATDSSKRNFILKIQIPNIIIT